MNDQAISALREALKVSPENVPLRRHLAQTLLSLGRIQEAVAELRHALSLDGRDVPTKLALAEAYQSSGNLSAAFVIVEELTQSPATPAAAHLLHSRLLLASDHADRAARAYRKAMEADASLADAELAAALGLDPQTGADLGAAEIIEDDEHGRIRVGPETGSGGDFQIERPRITFDDVGGMEQLKDEIGMKIIQPMQHPELYKLYGKAIGGGILMYGPPGCGKTYMARATAGQINAGFLAIGIHDVLDMWLGNSEKNLHGLFVAARRQRPCVLFFDEVDALGASRSDMRTSSAKHLINQFLAELDGVKDSNDGLLILGATNAPWHLDSAFRRPGRFDRVLFVPPPDSAGRSQILALMLKDKPCGPIDLQAVAAKTESFSGADLKAVVDLAVEAKLREAMKAGRPVPLSTKDLLAAAKTHRATTREWFATARNYAMYSNEGGLYDDVLKYIK